MTITQFLGASVLASCLAVTAGAQEAQSPYVQIAEIEIDPAQLDNYKAAVLEHAQAAVHVEPGVLTLYAVADQDKPTYIRVFEVYQDVAAYRAHLESAHFKKYKATTEKMVLSLNLLKASPIALISKQR